MAVLRTGMLRRGRQPWSIALHLVACLLAAALPTVAGAEISLNQIIVDFQPGAPQVHDIEVQNLGDDKAYVEVGVSRVVNPGIWPMERVRNPNPAELGLVATPARFVLAPGGARLIRLILTRPNAEEERIYRVSVTPKVGEVTDKRSGVKVVVGYEVLVIVRPTEIRQALEIKRNGNALIVRNTGNTNVLLPTVRQCNGGSDCVTATGTRIYAGRTESISLPRDAPVEAMFTLGEKTWTESFP